MKLRISKIQAMASDRPPGYVAAVIARGVIDGEWLEISSEALAELRGIYRPSRPPEPPSVRDMPEPPLPPLSTMAKNLAVAAVHETAAMLSGVPPLTADQIAARLSICTGNAEDGNDRCESYRPSDARCALCGCYLAEKSRKRGQRCPAGKWPPSTGGPGER